MGTNYYHRTKNCQTCGRCDEKHIGKSSVGWTFSFQGYDIIRSYKDWLVVLEKGGLIFDEYGDYLSINEFKTMVEAKRNAPKNHTKEYPNNGWLDDRGNSFSDTDFS